MRRSLALGILGLLAVTLGCGGAPGLNIGWVDNLLDVEPNAVAGERYDLSCPAGGMTTATVWGSDPYTDDSAICVAAVHAGKIGTYYGGTATIEVLSGQSSYTGSDRNGVVSLDHGLRPRSFHFP